MFIAQLFETDAKRIVVTYPGRFQPFHKGHRDVFASLQRRFGSENVFIVTSNKTDAAKSPFNFSDKVRFMHAMGVPDNQIIETSNVYDLPAQFEAIKDRVVFITAVGAPDEKRLAPGRIKKDGTQGYFQNLPQDSKDFQTADKHGYVIIAPESPQTITIGGKAYDVSHGTPTRELWNQVRNNPQQRAEFIQQLYGRKDGDLGHVLDKIPTGAPEPAPEPAKKMKNAKKDLTKVQHDPNTQQQDVAEEAAGVGVIATKKQTKDPRYSMSITKDVRPGQINKSLRAFGLIDEDLYQYDKADPYNSEFAPRAGMGRMTLRGWKQSMIRRVKEFALDLEQSGKDLDKAAMWDHVHKKLQSLNLDPIAQEIELAHQELDRIRRQGGIRSRAFKK